MSVTKGRSAVRRPGEFGPGRFGSDQWQFNSYTSTAAFQVGGADLAAVVLHDAVADAQSQSGAFARRFGGVEGIKDAVHILEPGAGVEHAQLQLLPKTSSFDHDALLLAELDRFDGVIQHVQQDLVEK